MERINKNIFDVNNTAEKSAESKAAAAEEAQAVEASDMAFNEKEKYSDFCSSRNSNSIWICIICNRISKRRRMGAEMGKNTQRSL